MKTEIPESARIEGPDEIDRDPDTIHPSLREKQRKFVQEVIRRTPHKARKPSLLPIAIAQARP